MILCVETRIKIGLQDAISVTDSFVFTPAHCLNLKVMRYGLASLNRILADKLHCVRLQLHGAIYRPDSFVLILRDCVNLKAITYESTSLNRIAADKSHRVIVA